MKDLQSVEKVIAQKSLVDNCSEQRGFALSKAQKASKPQQQLKVLLPGGNQPSYTRLLQSIMTGFSSVAEREIRAIQKGENESSGSCQISYRQERDERYTETDPPNTFKTCPTDK